MVGIQPHWGPGEPVGIPALEGIIRAAAPLIEGTGVATAEEIGVETFAQRLTDEVQAYLAVGAGPMLLGAWATRD